MAFAIESVSRPPPLPPSQPVNEIPPSSNSDHPASLRKCRRLGCGILTLHIVATLAMRLMTGGRYVGRGHLHTVSTTLTSFDPLSCYSYGVFLVQKSTKPPPRTAQLPSPHRIGTCCLPRNLEKNVRMLDQHRFGAVQYVLDLKASIFGHYYAKVKGS